MVLSSSWIFLLFRDGKYSSAAFASATYTCCAAGTFASTLKCRLIVSMSPRTIGPLNDLAGPNFA